MDQKNRALGHSLVKGAEESTDDDVHHFLSAIAEIEQRILQKQEQLEVVGKERVKKIEHLQRIESKQSELEIYRLRRESLHAKKKCDSQVYARRKRKLYSIMESGIKRPSAFLVQQKILLTSFLSFPVPTFNAQSCNNSQEKLIELAVGLSKSRKERMEV